MIPQKICLKKVDRFRPELPEEVFIVSTRLEQLRLEELRLFLSEWEDEAGPVSAADRAALNEEWHV